MVGLFVQFAAVEDEVKERWVGLDAEVGQLKRFLYLVEVFAADDGE